MKIAHKRSAKQVKISSEPKGLVICYIGAGKGKTTAAMGVVARAAGAGFPVYILQFVKAAVPLKGKKLSSGEWPLSNEILFFNSLKPVAGIGSIKTEQFGKGFVGILGDVKNRSEHVKAAKLGLARAKQILASKKYKLVLLDEIISAVELKLLTEQEVVKLLKSKPKSVHVIITGHNKFTKIIDRSDLVTEMNMIKHPYYQGILAQAGIDY